MSQSPGHELDSVRRGEVWSAGVVTGVGQLRPADGQPGHGGVGRGHPQPGLLLSCRQDIIITLVTRGNLTFLTFSRNLLIIFKFTHTW